MDGDIDKAIKRTHAYYPQVLRDQSQVYFRLRCQKFVEMIRQTAELLEPHPAQAAKPLNGHGEGHMDAGQTEMEVDDPKNEVEEWDKMEMEEADISVKYTELLEETIQYGQELKQEFQDDSSREAAFKEIFSLFMYEDPRKSPQAHLLDRASRVPVAEELNSAILGMSFVQQQDSRVQPPPDTSNRIADADGKYSIVGKIIIRRHRTFIPANRSPRRHPCRRRRRRGVDQRTERFPQMSLFPCLFWSIHAHTQSPLPWRFRRPCSNQSTPDRKRTHNMNGVMHTTAWGVVSLSPFCLGAEGFII